jgi:hypothetical protein
MTTIRFENTAEEFKEAAQDFLRSLKLKPERWMEAQSVALGPGQWVEVWGMEVPVSRHLAARLEWVCRMEQVDGVKCLVVGKQVWAAEIDCARLGRAREAFLREVEALRVVGSTESLKALAPLKGLKQLTSLNLEHCQSLKSLGPLKELKHLVGLNLSWCQSLKDLGPLSRLKKLKKLNLGFCISVKDLDPLRGLDQLVCLELGCCQSITELDPLRGLKRLAVLGLGGCESLQDLGPLKGLRQVTSLELSSCSSLSDLGPLKGLQKMTSLDLGSCNSLTDLGPLRGLQQLTNLNLRGCESLTDLTPLRGLKQLASLDLTGCTSLTDLGPLRGSQRLTCLNLGDCPSLSELGPLRGLKRLTRLALGGSQSLTDLGPLKGLRRLMRLEVFLCNSLADLGPLIGIKNLEALRIGECPRIRSLEALRHLSSLRELEITFHPSIVAELLAHTTALRSDRGMIAEKSAGWLEEAVKFSDGTLPERERFATTLGGAFSLLGEHAIEEPYEAYLQGNPDFLAGPWKAWLAGTCRQSGPGLLRRRVERQDVAGSAPGCLGGVCAVLPGEEAPAEDQAWARDWLDRLEAAWGRRGRELLPVSAEVCLAQARLGRAEPLGRWLDRFTDPGDPGALDPAQAALGEWQLARGNYDAALGHAQAIAQPEVRDPLLEQLVERWTDSDRAGRTLLLIESAERRRALALDLAEVPGWAATVADVNRLLVACGDSAEAMAELLRRLGTRADAELMQALSSRLGAGAESVAAWEQERLTGWLAASLQAHPPTGTVSLPSADAMALRRWLDGLRPGA